MRYAHFLLRNYRVITYHSVRYFTTKSSRNGDDEEAAYDSL
jgi:hypothetical protein